MSCIADGVTRVDFYVGETFIDGQQRDVWCNSKIPITDMRMHKGGKGPFRSADSNSNPPVSCFIANYMSRKTTLAVFSKSCVSLCTFSISFICE